MQACGNCRFYLANPGVCRANPPVPVLIETIVQAYGGPQRKQEIRGYHVPVLPDQWCGAWKERLNTGSHEIIIPTADLSVRSN